MKVFFVSCFLIIAAVAAIGEGLEKGHTEVPHTGENSSEGTTHKNIEGQDKIHNGSSEGDGTKKHANGTSINGGGLSKNISHSAKNLNGSDSHRDTEERRGSSRGNHSRNNHGVSPRAGKYRISRLYHRRSRGNSTRNKPFCQRCASSVDVTNGHGNRIRGRGRGRVFNHADDKSGGVGSHKNISEHSSSLPRNHQRGRNSYRSGSHKNVSGRPTTLHGTGTSTSTPSSSTINAQTTDAHEVTD